MLEKEVWSAWYMWLPTVLGSTISLWMVYQGWYHRNRYKQLRYACLAVAGGVLGWYSFRDLSINLIDHTEYHSFAYDSWIAPALLQVVLGLAGVVALGFTIFWSYEEYRFRWIFGFAPPHSHEEEEHKSELVDDRLRWLARWMEQMFEFESSVLREVSKKTEVGSEKDYELGEMKGWVATAKKRFWLAHNLARKRCLRVHPSYKDYLPPKSGKDGSVLRKV